MTDIPEVNIFSVKASVASVNGDGGSGGHSKPLSGDCSRRAVSRLHANT